MWRTTRWTPDCQCEPLAYFSTGSHFRGYNIPDAWFPKSNLTSKWQRNVWTVPDDSNAPTPLNSLTLCSPIFPINFQWVSRSRSLVNASAAISGDGQCSNFTNPFSTHYLIKWYWTSMSLVLAWYFEHWVSAIGLLRQLIVNAFVLWDRGKVDLATWRKINDHEFVGQGIHEKYGRWELWEAVIGAAIAVPIIATVILSISLLVLSLPLAATVWPSSRRLWRFFINLDSPIFGGVVWSQMLEYPYFYNCIWCAGDQQEWPDHRDLNWNSSTATAPYRHVDGTKSVPLTCRFRRYDGWRFWMISRWSIGSDCKLGQL